MRHKRVSPAAIVAWFSSQGTPIAVNAATRRMSAVFFPWMNDSILFGADRLRMRS